MSIKCDVLVVGGGPAGCSTARAAAKKGLITILIEEDKEIGDPVQCAEGIGFYLFKYMPFDIPKEQLIWKIEGMYFWANGIAIKKEGKIWKGYSINRKNWDQWLASEALKYGVKIYTNTKLQTLEFEKQYEVTKAVAISNGKRVEIEPKYVIAADGSESTIIDCLGVKKEECKLGYVKSYEIHNIKIKYPNYDQLFFGNFAPKAYAYIFPLSKNTANIGVGTLNKKDNLNDLYDTFIELPIIKNQILNAKILSKKDGIAPISDMSNKLIYGNVFLVGDAANQNIKPFLEGNIPSIICGDILGKYIFEVNQGIQDPSNYKNLIDKKFKLIKKSQKYADIIFGDLGVEDKMFNLILLGLVSEIVPPNMKKIEKFIHKGYTYLEEKILQNGGFIEKE